MEKKDPLISVIVPVYNVEKYLRRCVRSILAQTFTEFELILVDDGSKDACGKICDQYVLLDKRIKVIHKKNGGLSSARNSGIEYALTNSNSEWITFIDSDDWVSINYLNELYNNLVQYHAEISCCDYIRLYDEKDACEFVEKSNIVVGPTEKIWLDFLRGESYAFGKLYPKSFFHSLRYEVGRLYEDTALTHKLLFRAKRIVYSSAKNYYYYYNPNSITTTKWTPKKLDALWAHEQQLKAFKFSDYKKAYQFVLGLYIACIAQSLQKLRTFKGYRTVTIKYRMKLRYYLIFNRKAVDYNKYKKSYYFKSSYPVTSKLINYSRKKYQNAKSYLHKLQ